MLPGSGNLQDAATGSAESVGGGCHRFYMVESSHADRMCPGCCRDRRDPTLTFKTGELDIFVRVYKCERQMTERVGKTGGEDAKEGGT